MTRKATNGPGGKKSSRVLDRLSPDEALAVLKRLTAGSLSIRKKAEENAVELIAGVDLDDVAEDVYWALDSMAVEEVWDKSGRTCGGYVDPGDCAWRLFEDALEPFARHLQKCHELSLDEQAKLCCLGILKGIHRFETESTSECKSWATDSPGEYFISVFRQWKQLSKRKKNVAEVRAWVSPQVLARTGDRTRKGRRLWTSAFPITRR